MAGPSKEQISAIRWLSIVLIIAMFSIDYGFDKFAKEVPWQVYAGLTAVSIGIDFKTLRAVFTTFLNNWAGGNNGNR